MAIIPNSRPRRSLADTQKIIADSGVTADVVLVGVRGYYLDSMGKVGVNDRGIYDDAIFVVSPEAFVSFNANCDPSLYKMGMAMLKKGVYQCVKWRHKGKYAALQIVRDVLTRDGKSGETSGRRGINVHRGGNTDTFSEGCQTIPPSQYDAFIKLVYSEMDRHRQPNIPYILTENQE